MSTKLKPIQNRVVAEVIEVEQNKTAGGIYLPDTADKDKPQIAKVLAVGSGKEVSEEIKVGDEIIFGKYAGTEVKYEGSKYLLLSLDDIIAIVNK